MSWEDHKYYFLGHDLFRQPNQQHILRGRNEWAHCGVHTRRRHPCTLWGAVSLLESIMNDDPTIFTGRGFSFSCTWESCRPHIVTLVTYLSLIWRPVWLCDCLVLHTNLAWLVNGNMTYVILVFPGHQCKHLQWKFTGKELHFCKRRNVQSLPPTYSGLVPFLERCLPVMMKSLQITNDWTKWGYRRCGRCFSRPGEIPSHAWWLGKIINLCVFIFNHPI